MAIVVDSCVAGCWVMPDEFSEIANTALDIVSRDGMIVPSLFWYEFRNILLVNERRGRISSAQIDEGLMRTGSVPCEVDMETVERDLFRLARRHGLTIYDAAYLELALRTKSVLATLDKQLVRAAEAAGATLVKA